MEQISNHRILIVDDDKQLRIALQKIFRNAGYDAYSAPNGVEACEIVVQKEFDIILTDLRMPEKGGIELLSNIKNYKPQIPIVIMTAFGEPLSYYNAMEKGACEYIHKPIKKKEILDLVHRILNG